MVESYRAHGIVGAIVATTNNVSAQPNLQSNFPKEEVVNLGEEEEEEDSTSNSITEPGPARVRRILLPRKRVRRAFGLGTVEVTFFSPSAESHYFLLADHQPAPAFATSTAPRVVQLDHGRQKNLRETTARRKLLAYLEASWLDEGGST